MSDEKFNAYSLLRFGKVPAPETNYLELDQIDGLVHQDPRETDFRIFNNTWTCTKNIVVHDVRGEGGKFGTELKRLSRRLTAEFHRVNWEEVLRLPETPPELFREQPDPEPKEILEALFAKGETLRLGRENGPRRLVLVEEYINEPLVGGSVYSIFCARGTGGSGGKKNDIETTRYLTVESDILPKEYQRRVIYQLAREGLSAGIKLICVNDSGGKSIHARFRITDGDFRKEEKELSVSLIQRFVLRAVTLGADEHTLSPNAVSRVPNADRRKDDGDYRKQTLLFFRPEGFVGSTVPLPGLARAEANLYADMMDPPSGEPNPETVSDQILTDRPEASRPSCPIVRDGTDNELKEALYPYFEGHVKYDVDTCQFLVWDGRRWCVDRGGYLTLHLAGRAAEEICQRILEEALAAARGRNHAQEKAILAQHKLATKWKNVRNLEGAIKLLKGDARLRCLFEEFNRNTHLVAFRNCVVDLRTKEVLPHGREQLLTQLVPHDYLHDAPTPFLWNQQLERFACGNPDIVAFLKQFFGFCLTGDDSHQAILFLVGDGANGKDTLLNVMRHCLGSELCRPILKDVLLRKKDFDGGGSACSELGFIQDGVRLAFAAESGASRASHLDVETLKRITGENAIPIRHVHRQQVHSCENRSKIILATNHMPLVDNEEVSHGLYRRLWILQCDDFIQDKDIIRKFYSRILPEIPGILRELVDGACQDYREPLRFDRLPQKMQEAALSYRRATDQLAECFESLYYKAPFDKLSKKGAYELFRQRYPAISNELKQDLFSRRLKGFFGCKTDRNSTHFLGLTGRFPVIEAVSS
jgi:P4 family phage/plasmid primase-like protien